MRDGLVCLTLKITIRRGPPIEANVLLGRKPGPTCFIVSESRSGEVGGWVRGPGWYSLDKGLEIIAHFLFFLIRTASSLSKNSFF